jgi:hypothetical protein
MWRKDVDTHILVEKVERSGHPYSCSKDVEPFRPKKCGEKMWTPIFWRKEVEKDVEMWRRCGHPCSGWKKWTSIYRE